METPVGSTPTLQRDRADSGFDVARHARSSYARIRSEDPVANPHLTVSNDRIAGSCQRWKITEMSLFGSVVRDDFRPDSDIDVLVSFEVAAGWSLVDLVTIREELAALLGRPVDLVEEAGLRNPYRRAAILKSKQILYAA